jgi:hypothetical protein
MQRLLIVLLILIVVGGGIYYLLPRYTNYHIPLKAITIPEKKKSILLARLKKLGVDARSYTKAKGLSGDYCFLVDMSLPSGRNRFFVYDLEKDSVITEGLVAHGSCNQSFLEKPEFSNTTGSGCSSTGHYKVGYSYSGQFGKAYKLFGLDASNSNAFERAVVLHAYDCVPDYEIYPQPLCNSLGCPMLSYNFLGRLSKIIDKSKKPILLWMFE